MFCAGHFRLAIIRLINNLPSLLELVQLRVSYRLLRVSLVGIEEALRVSDEVHLVNKLWLHLTEVCVYKWLWKRLWLLCTFEEVCALWRRQGLVQIIRDRGPHINSILRSVITWKCNLGLIRSSQIWSTLCREQIWSSASPGFNNFWIKTKCLLVSPTILRTYHLGARDLCRYICCHCCFLPLSNLSLEVGVNISAIYGLLVRYSPLILVSQRQVCRVDITLVDGIGFLQELAHAWDIWWVLMYFFKSLFW